MNNEKHILSAQNDTTSRPTEQRPQNTSTEQTNLFRGVPPHIVQMLSKTLESAFSTPIPNENQILVDIRLEFQRIVPAIYEPVRGIFCSVPLTHPEGFLNDRL